MKKFNQEEFISKSSKIHNNKYDYSKVKYVDSRHKVYIICPEHGEFEQFATNHLQGHGCPLCSKGGINKKSQLQFIKEAQLIHNHKYSYNKTIYSGSTTKVIITCPIHGDFLQEANSHLKGHGCPLCKQSKGEELIKKILDSNHVLYLHQYEIPIDNSINPSGKAFVDFYLPKHNLFIEYNGKQHYVPIKHFGGELEFQRQQSRDQYLNHYCENAGISLLIFKFDDTHEFILQQLEPYVIESDSKE